MNKNNRTKTLAVAVVALMMAVGFVTLIQNEDADAAGASYTLYGAGRNNNSQQGDGTTTDVTAFTQRATDVAQVSCFNDTTWYVTTDGKLYGCGNNQYGQQGDGTTTNVTTFTQRATNVAQVACSNNTTWYVTTDGKLYGCGNNQYGQIGNPGTFSAFTQRATDVAQVSCFNDTTWYVTTDGTLYGCGNNQYGQQGDGTTTNVKTFTQRATDVAQVSSINNSTWYVTTDGKLYGCGSNFGGQQGDGTTTNVKTFTQRATDVAKVVCSFSTTWYVTTDGKLYGCGNNPYGQQGDGTTTDVTTFTQRATDVAQVLTSGYTTWYLEATPQTYTVTWKSQDGQTTLETDTDVEQGSTPSYDGAAPTKTATAQYTYTFAGWSTTANQTTGTAVGSLPTVSADVTYYAAFSETLNTYTITWTNYDDTVLETDTAVAYGVTPTYDGATPTKPSTAQYSYTFDTWTPAVASVTGDQTYKAVFTEGPRTYTVTWTNYDDSVLETDTGVAYGATPSYDGATPTRPATAQYTYTFDTWTPAISAVSDDQTYKATFTEAVNSYTVTIATNNALYGSVSPVSVASVPYGTVITSSSNTLDVNGTTVTATPAPADETYSYIFVDWSGVGAVNGNMTVTANFQQIEASAITITFNANGGNLEGSATKIVYTGMAYGTLPTASKINNDFLGWYTAADGGVKITADSIVDLEEDATLYAHYSLQSSLSTIGIIIYIIPVLLTVMVVLGLVRKLY